MKIKTIITASLIALSPVPFAVQAQTPPGATQPLPPALQAALLSGNVAAIEQAINVLSGGNPQRQAQLAQQVANAAERLVATNPGVAAAGALAAARVANQPAVIAASPVVAARIAQQSSQVASSPAVMAAAPTVAAQTVQSAALLVSNPQVREAAPTIVAAIQININTVVSNPTVMAASPTIVAAIQQQLQAVLIVVPNVPNVPTPPLPPPCGTSCAAT